MVRVPLAQEVRVMDDLATRLEKAGEQEQNDHLRAALYLIATNLRNTAHYARAAIRRSRYQDQLAVLRGEKLTPPRGAQ